MRPALLLLLSLFAAPAATAQPAALPSGVHAWSALVVEQTPTGERRPILAGGTTDLDTLVIHATTLRPGQAPHASHAHADLEELVIVKEGRLRVALAGDTTVIGPGSIALALPGDAHGFENAGDTPVTYYVFRYRSKAPMDAARGQAAGGSFVVDWDDVAFQPTETGGRRQHFDRATAMFERFEMHVSTLDEGRTNHAAHTHRAEEFVLILKSDVEMQIGAARHRATAGDLVFLASEIPHALDNAGTGQTEYFAFQWQ